MATGKKKYKYAEELRTPRLIEIENEIQSFQDKIKCLKNERQEIYQAHAIDPKEQNRLHYLNNKSKIHERNRIKRRGLRERLDDKYIIQSVHEKYDIPINIVKEKPELIALHKMILMSKKYVVKSK